MEYSNDQILELAEMLKESVDSLPVEDYVAFVSTIISDESEVDFDTLKENMGNAIMETVGDMETMFSGGGYFEGIDLN